MLGSGLPPVLAQVSGRSPLAAQFRPGQTLQAIVQDKGGTLVLRLGGQQIPLATDTGLAAGQTVTVRAEAAEHGLRLVLQPAPATPAAAGGNTALGDMIANVLKALGAERLGAGGARLLPAALPPTAARMEQLIALFTRPGGGGRDLNALMQFINTAAASGAFPADRAAELARWLLPEGFGDARDLRDRLLRFARQRAPEARLAALLADGLTEEGLLEFRSLLRQQLASLLDDEGLLAFLRARGEAKVFEQTLGRVLERWQAVDLQNLHGDRQPYFFFEVPAGDAFEYARVHVFGDGAQGHDQGPPGNASAVLDISLTQLGELWIHLALQGSDCRCTIRAANGAAYAALEADTADLRDHLAALGYRGVTVKLGRWDGDALRATAELMRRFGPLDLRT